MVQNVQLLTLIEYKIYTEKKALFLMFGYSEKATKFEKIFHSKFDATVVSNF